MAVYKQYSKKDGSKAWLFQAYLGVDEVTGKEVRTTRRGFSSKKAAQLKLNELILEFESNGLQKASATTFKEVYLLWYDNYKNTVKESTSMTTERFFNQVILPSFGDIRLEKVDVKFCQKVVNKWAEEYTSYRLLIGYTRKVFEYAVHIEVLKTNPFDKVIRPTKKEKKKVDKIKFYDLKELEIFLNHLEQKVDVAKKRSLIQHYYAEFNLALFRLMAFSGMRVGETLALNWSDIDYDNKTISISKNLSQTKQGYVVSTTKTNKSNRIISLDDKTLLVLKKWHLTQRKLLFKRGYNNNKMIFVRVNSNFITRNDIYQRSTRIAQACNLHSIGCHGFRHTHASLLFESGANFKEVQERLGHTDISMTMNIYTHVTQKAQEETAKKFANYVNF
ncbi:site-specific integrase [Vagococcus fluvialis]|uniref:Site-specific integrase n=1 Tax=Vagococcus fluvialis TaxID=2738 RepID=A0A7X6I1W1_9ENTE|nr:site-specific integrase [Vagococcus fluvialis]NKC66711.1 site-specific integrase [Vagococcus fluvialis]